MDALSYSKQPKIQISITAPLDTKADLSLAYTPGIAEVSKLIAKDPKQLSNYSFRRNNMAVISDGSAVLGLGNIGHIASYPVMEGKSMLLKRFANIDAIPIIIGTQDSEEFINTVRNIADSFSAINLEDISAPRCFDIEDNLKSISQPIMHDDQHGTAIAVAVAIQNALTLTNQDKDIKVVVSGSGAAGIGVTKLLLNLGYRDIILVDSLGIVTPDRQDLHITKKEMALLTNKDKLSGSLSDALRGANVFLGLSTAGILKPEMIKSMEKDPIIIAMANPIPEVMPEVAFGAGAKIVATGRSDFPNQVNNALAFPGIFRGAIDAGVQINKESKLVAVQAIIDYHKSDLSIDNLMPDILDPEVHRCVAQAVYHSLVKTNS